MILYEREGNPFFDLQATGGPTPKKKKEKEPQPEPLPTGPGKKKGKSPVKGDPRQKKKPVKPSEDPRARPDGTSRRPQDPPPEDNIAKKPQNQKDIPAIPPEKPDPKVKTEPKKDSDVKKKDTSKKVVELKPVEDMNLHELYSEMASYLGDELEDNIIEANSELFWSWGPGFVETDINSRIDSNELARIKYAIGLEDAWVDPLIEPNKGSYVDYKKLSDSQKAVLISIKKFQKWKKAFSNRGGAAAIKMFLLSPSVFTRSLNSISKNIEALKPTAQKIVREMVDRLGKEKLDLEPNINDFFTRMLEETSGDRTRKEKILKKLLTSPQNVTLGKGDSATSYRALTPNDFFSPFPAVQSIISSAQAPDVVAPKSIPKRQKESKTMNKNDIKSLIKEAFTDKLYGQYPYSHKMSDEDEPAPDYMETWKSFCSDVSMDKSREMAISIAKMLIRDPELFQDVLELVGQKQSVGAAILSGIENKNNMV